MSILIAVPTFENISPECFKAIYELEGDDLSFDFVKGYDCAKARNEIVKKALKGFDYVLMIDSDIVVPRDTLHFMLDNPADVCFGVYPRKNTKAGETELFKDGTFDFTNRYTFEDLKNEGPRIHVKGGGFGCVLIKTDVFKNIDYPWFEFHSYENNTFLSEDLSFCMKASYRYNLVADIRVRCGHVSKFVQYD